MAKDREEIVGIPKQVRAGQKTKRISADVEAGRPIFEGDVALAKRLVKALQHRGRFKRYTQGFHTYPARLHPLAARDLVEILGGESLADPFCGGGTLLVEGLLAKKRVFGSDLNEIATRVATARTRILSPEAIEQLTTTIKAVATEANKLHDAQQRLWLPKSILNIKPWYNRNEFNELVALYGAKNAYQGENRALIDSIFSSLLVKYSLRASDTSNRIVPIRRKPGTVLKAFEDKGSEFARNLAALAKEVPTNLPAAMVSVADATSVRYDEKLDVIVTSPPYPGTYDYIPLQQLRNAWFALETNGAIAREIGTRRSFRDGFNRGYREWIHNTNAWVRNARSNLKEKGKLCIIVGEGLGRKRKSTPVLAPTKQAALDAGLTFCAAGGVERKDPATGIKKIEYAIVFERS